MADLGVRVALAVRGSKTYKTHEKREHGMNQEICFTFLKKKLDQSGDRK